MEGPWPGPGQAIISIAQFYFEREVRTATGECYTILEEDKPVGRLGSALRTRYGSRYAGRVRIPDTRSYPGTDAMVIENLTGAMGIEREDFVIHVHQGRDLGVFSHNDSTLHEGQADNQTPWTSV